MADKVFVVQCIDGEEGSCARWFNVKNARFDTQEAARTFIRNRRKAEEESGYESLCSYRTVEEFSDQYYSQPTDRLEY